MKAIPKQSAQDVEHFMKKFQWANKLIIATTKKVPTTLEILATIMVMDDNDPTKLVELLREMEKGKNE